MIDTAPLVARLRHRVRLDVLERPATGDPRPGIAARARELLRNEAPLLGPADVERVVDAVLDDALGLGPLEPLMRDPSVTELIVNGPSHVYSERDGRLQRESVRFEDRAHLRHVIERIVAGAGRRVDESSPMVDARLPDGSRVNAVLPPVALDGPLLTIRRFFSDPLTVDRLVASGSLRPEQQRMLGL
ncbi:MAG: pilus assembly protein CpaF, partial [Gaiellales bacterium]|nr:pilus assembly protein CpaF [Gaiellales bacterium]